METEQPLSIKYSLDWGPLVGHEITINQSGEVHNVWFYEPWSQTTSSKHRGQATVGIQSSVNRIKIISQGGP